MKTRIGQLLTTLTALLIFTTAAAHAVAPTEEVVAQLKASGQFDAYVEKLRLLEDIGADRPGKLLLGDDLALGIQAVDTHRVLVILIDFPDKPYTAGYAAATTDDFDSLLFSENRVNPTGSMTEFYYENSYGNYVIRGTTVGWFSAPVDHDYFTNGFLKPADLIRFAVQDADALVDYSQYDNDGDGYVEGVIVVHSGTGAEESGDLTEIHSHRSRISPAEPVDGVWVSDYTVQPEESAISRSMSAIGVFCHEWGHILGLPDLYDIDGGANEGVGRWSLMGAGNYNGASKLPSHFDPWSKKMLGWLTPVRITENSLAVDIPAVEFNPVVYYLRKDGTYGSEYWLVENRQMIGFDAGLMGEGIMVWHIDEDVINNTSDWHPMVFLEQADGRFDLQYGNNRGDAGDPWPYLQKTEFHDKTTPGSKYYSDFSSQVAMWNISASDSVMTADFEIAFTRPWLSLNTVMFRDDAFGNGNQKIEAGERIQIFVSLMNEWAPTDDIQVTVSGDDPRLSFGIETVDYAPLGTDESGLGTVPFEFEVPDPFTSRIDSFFFAIEADAGGYAATYGSETTVGLPQILILDDDNGDADQLQTYLSQPLYDNRKPADTWQKVLSGSPEASDLQNYATVLWQTGDYRENLLSFGDIEALKDFLDGGGNLFLTGQGLAGQLAVQDPDFLNNYLKADYVEGTFSFIPVLNTTDGPVSGDLRWIAIQGSANNQTVFDHVRPAAGGLAEWEFLGVDGDFGGVSYMGDYKSVFFAFGLEGLKNNDTTRFEPSWNVLAQVLDFFADIPTDADDDGDVAAVVPRRLELDQNYPNPFNPTTTISYTVTGSRTSNTRLEVFNILGRHVTTLVDRVEGPGQYTVIWNGRASDGRQVASGTYLYRITRDNLSESRKMILLK